MPPTDSTESSAKFLPIMVAGERRSGTTLVANFLNSQRGFSVHSDLLRSLFSEAKRLGVASTNAPLSDRERNILLSNLEAEGLETGMPLFSKIDRAQCGRWLDIYMTALAAMRTSERVVGTKVTGAYELMPGLLDAGVRIVFCIRDPRDVCLSAMNRFSGYDLFDFVAAWKRSVDVAKQLRSHRNVHLVRFEDLVGEKRDDELRALGTFLGEKMDLTATPKHRSNSGFQANSSYGDIARPFDPAAKDRWKRVDQSLPEVVFPSSYLAKDLEKFGYEYARASGKNYSRLSAAYHQYLLTRRVASGARNARKFLRDIINRPQK